MGIDPYTGKPKPGISFKGTPRRLARIVKGIKQGLSYEKAAHRAGLSDRAVKQYRDLGAQAAEKLVRGEPLTAREDAMYRFNRATMRAEAAWEGRTLRSISMAGDADPKHWTAKAWMLERRYPDRYGRRERVDHDHKHKITVTIGGIAAAPERLLAPGGTKMLPGTQRALPAEELDYEEEGAD